MWGHCKKIAVCTQRGSSPEPKHAGNLILDFQLPKLWKINFFCLYAKKITVYSLTILNELVFCSLQLYLKIYLKIVIHVCMWTLREGHRNHYCVYLPWCCRVLLLVTRPSLNEFRVWKLTQIWKWAKDDHFPLGQLPSAPWSPNLNFFWLKIEEYPRCLPICFALGDVIFC